MYLSWDNRDDESLNLYILLYHLDVKARLVIWLKEQCRFEELITKLLLKTTEPASNRRALLTDSGSFDVIRFSLLIRGVQESERPSAVRQNKAS